MRRSILIILFSTFMCGFISAQQDYSGAVGIRLGTYNGVTGKMFLNSNSALEGILSSRWNGFNLTGLYEFHKNAGAVHGLNWYIGGGASLGFWDNRYYPYPNKYHHDEQFTEIAANGILGLEYNFEFPLNLSIDWIPSFGLLGNNHFYIDGIGISARYYFD